MGHSSAADKPAGRRRHHLAAAVPRILEEERILAAAAAERHRAWHIEASPLEPLAQAVHNLAQLALDYWGYADSRLDYPGRLGEADKTF